MYLFGITTLWGQREVPLYWIEYGICVCNLIQCLIKAWECEHLRYFATFVYRKMANNLKWNVHGEKS